MDGLIEAFVKLFMYLIAIAVVLYLIALAIAITAFVAMLLAGILSVYIVKSARALVREDRPGPALALSLAWASVLTVGCILGSFALFVASANAFGDEFVRQMERTYGEIYDFQGFLLFVDNWILGSAHAFFVKTTAAIYLANRVFIARRLGGDAWLGIVPPLGAMVIFFAAEHWELILGAFSSRSHLERLALEAWQTIYLPVDLAIGVVKNPDAVVQWGIMKFKQSNGSLFKLASLFPTIFWIIAIAFGIKALAQSTDITPA